MSYAAQGPPQRARSGVPREAIYVEYGIACVWRCHAISHSHARVVALWVSDDNNIRNTIVGIHLATTATDCFSDFMVL